MQYNFFQVPVNYFAVLTAGIAAMVVGFLWYGPLFGKEWMRLVGLTAEKMEKAKKKMGQTYAIMFAGSLVMAWILFHFIWYAAPGAFTLFIAVKVAIYAWIGFVATVSLSRILFSPERKSMRLFMIENGYTLVTLVVMALIFFLFK
jgi:hypothetical protein